MSLGRETVRGALWTVSAGMGARVFGLVGTLVVVRFVSPDDYGSVTMAAVLVMTANQLSTVGLGQYIVSHNAACRRTAFHATVIHVSLGVLAMLAVVVVGNRFGWLLDAPALGRFLPGLALAGLVDRVSFVPERVLVRDLRFAAAGAGRTAGELVYSGTCVALAALGLGPSAVVVGNLARSLVRAAAFVACVDRRDWLQPCRITFRRTREMLRFGIPVALGSLCSFASRRWDNLLVSALFGPGPAGMYNLAYNLADVPAIHVGEQIGDVLLPSFARMEATRRPAALTRSLALLSVVVFPLAVGLGVEAPTLVAALFTARWRPIGPMLVVLSGLSVARPIGWTIASYLQARHLPSPLLALEALKLLVLLLSIITLGARSPLWTCACVGLAFGAHAIASLVFVKRLDGVALAPLLASLARVLASCIPMVVAVLLLRAVLGYSLHLPSVLRLLLETLLGAVVYPPSALLFAPSPARDLLARVVDAVRPLPRHRLLAPQEAPQPDDGGRI